jgi:GH43 family beta-xylosidase
MKSIPTLLLLCLFAGRTWGETFHNPILVGADPSCQAYNGYYYFMHTDGGLNVRRTAQIAGTGGLGIATAVSVFSPAAPYDQGIIAPEIKYINGNWYIYYSAGTVNDSGDISHRMFCLRANTADPQGSYTLMGKVYDPGNDLWAIDGNVLQKEDGSLYFVWCGRSANVIGPNRIYIAPMSNPWTINGPRILISNPTYSWENGINEAPTFINRNGKIFLLFSANCSCADNYCLGQLVNTNGNVLNPGAWVKKTVPIFQSYSGADGAVYAPGSCIFTKSPNQVEDWIIYHTARFQGSGFNREIHAQKFTWNVDDSPNLGHPIPTGVAITVPFADIIIDNTNAVVVGTNWSTGTTSTNKFGLNYRFSAQGSGMNYVQYIPDIPTAGLYQVFAWYPQGMNRTTNAPYVIHYNGGSQTVYLNQQSNGGQWNLLGQFNFAVGTNADVKVTDALPDSPKVVLADAVKFVYVQPPGIVTQPQSQIAKVGTNVTFSVSATGSAPLSYQWRLNGSNVITTTTNSYTLANVQANQAGNYSVLVTNAAGAVLSSNAMLTVTLPQPAHIDSFTLTTGGQVQINASGERGSSYIIQNSSNLAVWMDIATVINTNGAFQYSIEADTNIPRSFYRTRLGP